MTLAALARAAGLSPPTYSVMSVRGVFFGDPSSMSLTLKTGVLIIYAKLSDIFGRKSFLIIAIAIFVIFSGACGAAQTIDQL